MGIRFKCPNGHALNVKERLAGRRGFCPHCSAKLTIPFVSTPEGENSSSTDKTDKTANTDTASETRGTSHEEQDPHFLADMNDNLAEILKTEPEKSSRTLKNYKILEVISRGGMGRVSLARDTKLERLVAIKEIRSRFAHQDVYRRRMILEAKITGFLDHPGIVPVYALEEDENGNPFYVMRRLRGISFDDAIEAYHTNRDPQKLRELLRHFTVVCQIVGYAHHEGIIHRDLKPGNMMLGSYGATFVFDWGLAKKYAERSNPDELNSQVESTIHENMTQITNRVGTRWYKAPEYIKTGISHPLNDIYALGMVLYKILTNKLPYDDLKMDEKGALAFAEPVPPGEVVPGISKPLAAICMKAISKNIMSRYMNVLNLGEDVQKWLENMPVSAYEYSMLERIGQYIARKLR